MNDLILTTIVLLGVIWILYLYKDSFRYTPLDVFFYLTLLSWVITSNLGARERYSSPNFDLYFNSNIPTDVDNLVGYFLGHTPGFLLGMTIIAAFIILMLYRVTFTKKTRNIIGAVFVNFLAIVLAIRTFQAILEMYHWDFHISLIAELNLLLVIFVFVLSTLKRTRI